MTAIDNPVTHDPGTVASELFERMEQAWERGDGATYGDLFADETDFVNIHGFHIRGDGALVGRCHQGIFDTIYSGSKVRYRVEVARDVAPGCIVAVVRATLEAPIGPMQGVHPAIITAIITDDDGRWSITAFQNTLVREVS